MIRKYCPNDDRKAVLDIWLAASRVGHPFLTEADLAGQYALVRDQYLDVSTIYVIEEDGKIVGFIGLIGELGDFIGALFVSPAYHRHGFGRKLIEYVAGLRSPLFVEVYAKNKQGMAFYEKNGFVEESRRDHDDEGRPLEIVRLRRD